MNLPIDIVPGTNPPKFKWQQTVDALGGVRKVDCEGALPPSVEESVKALITLAKQQAQEIIGLRRMVEDMASRVAAQSELLTARSEQAKRPSQQGQPKAKG